MAHDTADTPAVPKASNLAPLDRRGRLNCFVTGAISSLATSYYFNYLFFYLRDHFDYGNHENLLIAGFQGLLYTVSAYLAGRFIQRVGHTNALKVGFLGMGAGMVLGTIAPHVLGYGKSLQWMEWAIVVIWTTTMCQTWPALQAMLGRGQTREQLSRTTTIYNLTWSSMTALAYLTSGALLQHFGGEVLFWVPALMHGVQLVLLEVEERRQKRLAQEQVVTKSTPPAGPGLETADSAARLEAGKNFLHLAWVSNPFAYTAIYALLPVIPKLADAFHLTPQTAGFVCSIWQWSRMGSFVLFYLWPGWHYRFRWLLLAFFLMAGSFLTVLLASQLWLLIVAQILFGLCVGLIYSSSLFYSMDLGISGGKGGGIHEAVIGLGMFMGPATGVLSLQFFPTHPSASTWGTTGLLVIGLVLFLRVRLARQK